LAIGNKYRAALRAAEILKDAGVSCGVADMRFAKPLDGEIIRDAFKKSKNIVTVEDNALAGGFGSAIAEFLADNNMEAKILRLGIKDEFVEHAKPAQLHDLLGTSAEKISDQIKGWLK